MTKVNVTDIKYWMTVTGTSITLWLNKTDFTKEFRLLGKSYLDGFTGRMSVHDKHFSFVLHGVKLDLSPLHLSQQGLVKKKQKNK